MLAPEDKLADPFYDTAAIRKLLMSVLSDQELRDLCFDYFREAYHLFSDEMGKDTKVHHLLEHCYFHGKLDDLLMRTRQYNPGQYEKLASQLGV